MGEGRRERVRGMELGGRMKEREGERMKDKEGQNKKAGRGTT